MQARKEDVCTAIQSPRQIKDMLDWIAASLAPQADALDAAGRLPAELVHDMARRGVLGAAIDSAYGGLALEPTVFGSLCEALGHASASVLSLLTVHSMTALALARLGTRAQRHAWLPRLASGEAIGAFALTEPEVGSDVEAIGTSFRLVGDDVIVSGVKSWVSFGQIASVFLVIGKLDGQVTALLVPADTRGLQIEPVGGMAGFRAGMLATLVLDGCVLPRGNLLGHADFGLSQIVGLVLDLGRFCIAWGAVGVAQACLEASVARCATRVQFGKPLDQFQLVQRMIADMMVETHAARLTCADAAAARVGRGPDMIVRGAAAKYVATRAADRAAAAAVQLHGAEGLRDASPVQRFLRDAKVMNVIEGSTQIQQLLIAQHGRLWLDAVKSPS